MEHLGPMLHSVAVVAYDGVCSLYCTLGLKHPGLKGPLLSYWKLKVAEAGYHVAPVRTGLQTELTHSVYFLSICPL